MSSIGSVLSAFAGAFFSQLAGFIFGRLAPYLGAAAGLILGGGTGLVTLNLAAPAIPIYKIATSNHIVLFNQFIIVFNNVTTAILLFFTSIIEYITLASAVISNIVSFSNFVPVFLEFVQGGPSERTLRLD